MTAAARSFCPRVAAAFENRRPAPFGRLPSGRSTRRAAAATPVAVNPPAPAADGRTSWKSAQPAVKPEIPSSVGVPLSAGAGPLIEASGVALAVGAVDDPPLQPEYG